MRAGLLADAGALVQQLGFLPPAVGAGLVALYLFRADLLRVGAAILDFLRQWAAAERQDRSEARALEAQERAAGVDALSREAAAFREAVLGELAEVRAELLRRAEAEATCEARLAGMRAELERALDELQQVRERLALVEAELQEANERLGHARAGRTG